MSWTQPCCGSCWQAYSYGMNAKIRAPHKAVKPKWETCCFCATETDDGIYIRADPNIVPFPSEEKP